MTFFDGIIIGFLIGNFLMWAVWVCDEIKSK